MAISITRVRVPLRYPLKQEVVLDTGEKRLLNKKPYLNFGVFKRIRNYENFKRVRVAFDTIEWDEGVDLDPEFIYANSKPR